ncbi:hypothetical protein [Paraburkholderia xenovorans]
MRVRRSPRDRHDLLDAVDADRLPQFNDTVRRSPPGITLVGRDLCHLQPDSRYQRGFTRTWAGRYDTDPVDSKCHRAVSNVAALPVVPDIGL